MNTRAIALIAALACTTFAGASDASAQLGRLKKAARQAAGQKAVQSILGSADTTTAAATGGVPATDAAPAGAVAGTGDTTTTALRPGEGAWVNYDFVPGERPLFVEDFATDPVGDFPRRMEFRKGNMEVAEWQGTRFLRATTKSEISLPLGEVLPERFTLEFDMLGLNKYDLEISFTDDPDAHTKVHVGSWQAGVRGGGVEALSKPADAEDVEGRFVRVRVMADGRYVKVYLDDRRVANVPNADLGRSNRIDMMLPAYEGIVDQILIGDVRVMAGGRKLYDAIAGEGRVATQGILFDTGSDRLRPESTPTLKEIAGMLKEHGELRLRIEGHTDDVGDDAANLSLSERRAAAVAAFLVEMHGIDAARLESAGLGETRPVAGNDTPEGRQTNRRVELVRM